MTKRHYTLDPALAAKLDARNRKIFAEYIDGATLRELGEKYELSFERVAQLIRRDRPEIMRPMHVVPVRRRRKLAA